MTRRSARKRAAQAANIARWQNTSKRSRLELAICVVPDIDNQLNENLTDSAPVCQDCAERNQKKFVSVETQTIESYKNSSILDWFVFLFLFC